MSGEGKTSRFLAAALGAALVMLAACDDLPSEYYSDLRESFIDTVMAADTIRNNETVRIVHVYPAGCNHFERFESKEVGAALHLAALYHFYFEGQPCAHGSGLDTTSCRLSFSSIWHHFLVYRKNDEWRVMRSIYVIE